VCHKGYSFCTRTNMSILNRLKQDKMLGSKSKSKPSVSAAPGAQGTSATCKIAQDTYFEGKFSSKEDVRLDGEIKGEVICVKRLVMGETGKIDGKITTEDAVIMGRIDGDLIVKNTLHLTSTAFINGNISAKSMKVDEGARYSGECKVGSTN